MVHTIQNKAILLDKNCYFNKGFLLKLSQLYFKQSSAEDAYDLFPPEGYGIERGRKRI